MSEPNKQPTVPGEEPDDDGDATPHWAELPRLEIGDQASMSMAIRFPPLPEVRPEQPPSEGKPADFIVVRDEFAALRQLERLRDSTSKPADPAMSPGTPLIYGIVVRNTTPIPMYDVRIEHDLPVGVRYLKSDPPARLLGRRLVWEVGTFESGSKQRFKIHVQPNRPDAITPESRADFRVYQCLRTRTRLLRPNISIRLELPNSAAVGDTVRLKIEAVNAGPGSAEDVRLVVALPRGLAPSEGGILQFLRPRLGPREQFEASTDLHINESGSWTVPVHLVGNGKLLASSSADLEATTTAPTPTIPLTTSIFLLELSERFWAIPVSQVVEVHRNTASLPDGLTPIDLRRALNLPPGGFPGRIVLVRGEHDRTAALAVDRTLGVVRLTFDAEGKAVYQGRPVALLDVNGLFGNSPESGSQTEVPISRNSS